jgi:YegS/Rv2252/BmrU family lipid kinase
MIKRSEKVLVILNPQSGLISKDLATTIIFKRLRERFDSVSMISTNSLEHGRDVTQQAMEHFDVIAAFGGDGTVNSIASVLLNSNKTLAILPGGSGNGLARNLNISLSWRRALDTLINGRDVMVDAGKINNCSFFNIAGIGLDAIITKKFNLESKIRGILPYVYFALKGYFEMPTFRIQATIDDIQFEEEILLTAFANFKQYGGKAIIAPNASPYDRLLDLCILKKVKLLKSTLNIQRLFTGNIHRFPFYRSYKFEKIHIRSLNGPIPFQFDGEFGGEESTTFDVEVLPASLKVRIPETSI